MSDKELTEERLDWLDGLGADARIRENPRPIRESAGEFSSCPAPLRQHVPESGSVPFARLSSSNLP